MSKEKLTRSNSEIISSPEELSPNVSYQELIEKYGGKAAGLLWIKKHLPETPMAKMVIAPPQTREEEITQAAKQAGLKFPWIIRPSNPHDNEIGYEGKLPTEIARNDNLEDLVRRITYVKYAGFEGENTVIVAEKTEGNLYGTLVMHPNRPGKLLINVSSNSVPADVIHAFFKGVDGKVKRSINYCGQDHEKEIPKSAESGLVEICRLVSKTLKIPEFDNDMTYQFEFCPGPVMIYQIRDFMGMARPSFEVPPQKIYGGKEMIIFGSTPPKGIEVVVYEYNRYHLNDELYRGLLRTDIGIGVFTFVGQTKYINFPTRVNILEGSGLFAHSDIRMARKSGLTVYTPTGFDWETANGSLEKFQNGGVYRIISNGINIHISRLS